MCIIEGDNLLRSCGALLIRTFGPFGCSHHSTQTYRAYNQAKPPDSSHFEYIAPGGCALGRSYLIFRNRFRFIIITFFTHGLNPQQLAYI
ncbi:hypothetical protein D3C73_1360260 [compost metagenome]